MEKSVSLDQVKLRMSLSPTGLLHLGAARIALLNFLMAQHARGHLLFRLEDTEAALCDVRYAKALEADLAWLGIEWDEGISKGGRFGPYQQSQRAATYADYCERLHTMRRAYPCFCSDAQLADARRTQLAQGKPPRYAGTCRDLSPDVIAEKTAAGIKSLLRFRVPANETILFSDMLAGQTRVLSDDISDFVLCQRDGHVLALVSNALDDALMGVTHVLRSEHYMSYTPRQVLLLSALGLHTPAYGHVAPILGVDNHPLSLKNGDQTLDALRSEGYLPTAIVNCLVRLGVYFEREAYGTLADFAQGFSLAHLNKTPTKFNPDQLLHWQKSAVQHVTSDVFWAWAGAECADLVPAEHKANFLTAVREHVLFPKDVQHWASCLFGALPAYCAQTQALIKQAPKSFFVESVRAIARHGGDLRKVTNHLRATQEIEGRQMYQLLRVALTDALQGPDLEPILGMMPVSTLTERLERARDL